MYKAEFHVNVDAVVAGADFVANSFSRIENLIERELTELTKLVIESEFSFAVNRANTEGGFPEEFQSHLMESVRNITPAVFFDGHEVFVGIDFEEQLGGLDDLTKAFHQGATLATGGKLWGPYTGQDLKQDDPETRHIFWEALRRGDSVVEVDGRQIHLPESAWEETVNQYLSIWGDKAPEWLFIQFGQEEWHPYIPQTDLINEIQESVQSGATRFLEMALAESVAIANSYKTTGIEVGYTGTKSAPRVISGTFEANGKVYRPGRFAPRSGF